MDAKFGVYLFSSSYLLDIVRILARRPAHSLIDLYTCIEFLELLSMHLMLVEEYNVSSTTLVLPFR